MGNNAQRQEDRNVTTKGRTPAPVKTEKSLADSALANLRKANEAEQRAAQKKAKLDDGFTPANAGYSLHTWNALSLDARLHVINLWVQKRQTELKKAQQAQ